MATVSDQSEPTVVMSSDKLVAQLIIPQGYDRALITQDLILGLIRGAGVEVTDYTNQVVKELDLNKPPEDQDITLDVACAQPAVNGIDGEIQWLVDQQQDEKKEEAGGDDEAVCFYDRSAFVLVQTGDEIGRVHPATPGEDGRDVTGNTLPAKSGKEAPLTLDESIMRRADGVLIAQDDGVLYREPGKAQIRKKIEISDYVDFSTGNIDFDGDITVAKGVRDCFIVKATGNVEVHGLIEAATIKADGDLIATGGFAGRERGYAHIGGSLRGKYLDNVHGHVSQDLCVDREVINCEFTIDGAINSAHGAIIGGRITPTGAVNIGTLGSGAGVATELVIGSVPTLQPFAEELTEIIKTLEADHEKLTEERDMINSMSTKGKMTAVDKERQTEIMFELSLADTSLDKSRRTLDNVNRQIDKRRCVNVTVHRKINPGVRFILGDRCYKMTQELRGPVRIYLDNKHNPVYRVGDSPPVQLVQVAESLAIIPGREAA